ncbi:MAG TPA: hypothetical protein VFQ63_00350 [Patescibacteria group bacterium]|nr:hypothetical protein [Patescibacteria group bacterium]
MSVIESLAEQLMRMRQRINGSLPTVDAAADISRRSSLYLKQAESLKGTPAYETAVFLAQGVQHSEVVDYVEAIKEVAPELLPVTLQRIGTIYNAFSTGGTVSVKYYDQGYTVPKEESRYSPLTKTSPGNKPFVEDEVRVADGIIRYVSFGPWAQERISQNDSGRFILGGREIPSTFFSGLGSYVGDRELLHAVLMDLAIQNKARFTERMHRRAAAQRPS